MMPREDVTATPPRRWLSAGIAVMKTRAVILSEHNLQQWQTRFRTGDAPSELPYGIEDLRGLGFTLTAPASSQDQVGALWTKVEHRLGMPVRTPLLATAKAARADIAIALLEQFAVLPTRAKALGIPPWRGLPLTVLACWLGERLSTASEDERRAIVSRYARADLVAVWSANQVPILTESGFGAEQVVSVPFGVATRWFTPADGVRDIELLAVGQDAGRDFPTLLEAVRGTRLQLTIVARNPNLGSGTLPGNVTVLPPVPHVEYRNLLRRSRVAVVPTKELAYPTGQSVAMEAASTGCAVVVTDTRPMREYFTDGETALMPPVADPAALRQRLLDLTSDETALSALAAAGRDHVVAHHDTRHLWTAFRDEAGSRGLLERAARRARVG